MPISQKDPQALRRVSLAGCSLIAILAAGSPSSAADSGAAPTDEVVVSGQYYAAAKSLDEQKNSDTVSNYISADDMGRIPDNTVAESIGRVPGINILNDQETGEGQYVTIRSLASTYNAFLINGNRVAETDPGSRQVSLDVLPPNGLAGVKISKTLTPDMDGDAIAGTVDVRTPSAFDFDKPLARIFYNFGINDRAVKDHDPSDANSGQFDLGWRFGPEQRFGVYITGYYTDTNIATEESENDQAWTPFLYQGNSLLPVNQNSLQLPGLDLDYRVVEQKRGGGNVSFDYRGDDTKLYLRSQYSDYTRVETHDQLAVRSIDTANTCNFYTSCSSSGTYSPQGFEVERELYTQDQHEDLGMVDLGGESKFGSLTLDYDTAYSWGELSDPHSYTAAFDSTPSGASGPTTAPFNQTGVLFSEADPRFPQWQLPAYAQGAVYNNSLLLPAGASLTKDSSTDKRFSAKLDARYDLTPPSWLDEAFVKAGVKYMVSNRQYTYHDITESNFATDNLATSGLVNGSLGCFLGCAYQFGPTLSRSGVISAINAMGATANLGLDDENGNDTKNHEAVYAGYLMGNIKFHDIEIIAGLRTETTSITNTFWVQDDPDSHWGVNHRTYTNVLPSINVNYRPDPTQVYRAAVWTSFSRPEFDYISGGASVTRNAGEIVAITEGNPNLKAATALNVDTSAEWYFNKTSMVSIAPFYKRIKDYVITNGDDTPASNYQGFVEITRPENGNPATVYGIEFGLAKDLRELAPPFDGFGVFGNLTRQNSDTTTALNYITTQHIPLIYASKLSYNGGVNYQKYGFEAQLSYHWQGPYLMSLRNYGINKWQQSNSSLNFSSRYNFDNGFTIGIDATNLTDNYTTYDTRGENPSYQKDYIEPGRTITMKASYTF